MRNVRIRPPFANKEATKRSATDETPESKRSRLVGGLEVCQEIQMENLLPTIVETLDELENSEVLPSLDTNERAELEICLVYTNALEKTRVTTVKDARGNTKKVLQNVNKHDDKEKEQHRLYYKNTKD